MNYVLIQCKTDARYFAHLKNHIIRPALRRIEEQHRVRLKYHDCTPIGEEKEFKALPGLGPCYF